MRIIATPLIVFLYLLSVGMASALLGGTFGWNNAEKPTLLEYLSLLATMILGCYSACILSMFAFKKTFKLVFQMSSQNQVVFSSDDRSRVESMRDDVINGIERGYFPNYLQNK